MNYNLDDNAFVKNRVLFHAASRIAIQTGQSLAQATNVDGHIVTDAQIWTAKNSEFPKNTGDNKTTSDVVAATNDLVTVFKEGAIQKKTLGGGVVWTNDAFPAVELYEKVEMTAVEYSDNQAWEILDGTRVMDWVAPTSVKDNGTPVPGFSGIVEANTNEGGDDDWIIIQKSSNLKYGWELAKGTWEFAYMSGMLVFHPDYIPSKMSYSKIRITAFKYVGSYLTDNLSDMIAIQPYQFAFDKLTVNEGVYSITLDGFIMQVLNDAHGVIIGDYAYNADGTTTITFGEITDEDFTNTKFTAYGFVNKNGNKIKMLSTIIK